MLKKPLHRKILLAVTAVATLLVALPSQAGDWCPSPYRGHADYGYDRYDRYDRHDRWDRSGHDGYSRYADNDRRDWRYRNDGRVDRDHDGRRDEDRRWH